MSNPSTNQSHAVDPINQSKVPLSVQKNVPEGLERALPDSIHNTDPTKNKDHRLPGNDDFHTGTGHTAGGAFGSNAHVTGVGHTGAGHTGAGHTGMGHSGTGHGLSGAGAGSGAGVGTGVGAHSGTGHSGFGGTGAPSSTGTTGGNTHVPTDPSNPKSVGVSHATGPSKVPEAIQKIAPKGLEKALPESIHPTNQRPL